MGSTIGRWTYQYIWTMNDWLDIRPRVAEALEAGTAVVALESSLISHGLPFPDNLETARALEDIVLQEGAVPATVGIVEGCAVIGLGADEMMHFARSDEISKASRRDLAVALARREHGATTVAATMIFCARAGIRVLATGGIGGVHRGAETTMDISADVMELARSDVAVVCSGAKSILDIAKTLEVLETQGVPVVGYRSDRFPAFHARDSGFRVYARADTPAEAAEIVAARRMLGLGGGVLIANPVPKESAIDGALLEGWIDGALAEAADHGVTGSELTPFLLERLAERSGGRTLAANKALLRCNATLAARIAVALEQISTGEA